MSDAMSPDRVNAWVSQRNFKSMSRSWIAPQRGIEVFNDALEHLSIHQILVKNG
jgi:hypothetical protein